MLIEIYNQDGIRVLDNETKVLKTVQKLTIPQGQTFFYSNRNQPNSWYTDYSAVSNAANSNTSYEFAITPGYTGATVDVTDAKKWVRPKNNTSVATADAVWGVAMENNTSQRMVGEGLELAYIKPTVANDASGLIDCYSPTGELMWSLASLINAPQVLRVLDFPTVRTFDLNTIEASKRDKIFFYPIYEGEFDVIYDDTSGTTVFRALVITRSGNMVYFKETRLNTFVCKVLVGYIP